MSDEADLRQIVANLPADPFAEGPGVGDELFTATGGSDYHELQARNWVATQARGHALRVHREVGRLTSALARVESVTPSAASDLIAQIRLAVEELVACEHKAEAIHQTTLGDTL